MWHTIFMVITALLVSAGIKNGIGRMVKILMPMLGFLMIFMVIYSMINGDFAQGHYLSYLLQIFQALRLILYCKQWAKHFLV